MDLTINPATMLAAQAKTPQPLSSTASSTPLPSPSPSPSITSEVPVLPGERLADWGAHLFHELTGHVWLLPLAAFGVLVAVVGWQAGRARVQAWRHQRLEVHAQQVVITPPPEVEAGGAGLWWAHMAGILRPALIRRLVWGTPHIGLEYRWAGRELRIVVWVPGSVPAGPVADAVRAAWPGATAQIQDATPPLPLPGNPPGSPRGAESTIGEQVAAGRGRQRRTSGRRVVREVGGALAPTLPGWYPMAAAGDHDVDPLRALIAAGSGLHAAEAACVQILVRPASPATIRAARAGAAALRTGRPTGGVGGGLSPDRMLSWVVGALLDVVTPGSSRGSSGSGGSGGRGGGGSRAVAGVDPLRERDARPGLDKVAGPLWEVAIRLAVTHTTTSQHTVTSPSSPSFQAGRGLAGLGRRPKAGRGLGGEGDAIQRRLTVLAHGLASAMAVHDARNRLRRLRMVAPSRVLAGRVMRSGFLLGSGELAAIAALPTDVAVAGLDRARAKAVPAPIAVPGGGRGSKVLGTAQVGGHSVALPVVDGRQHLHVLGSTGVGKSTLLSHLILDDIRAGRGVVLIDPKGDLARDVLALLPASVADRLVLIDPDQPVGSAFLNPLELRGADADVIVDNIVSIFASIFQRHWGPRIDDVLRVACLTLMRHPNPTLANVTPLLTNKQFRAPFTAGLNDPEGLLGFWQWYESTPPQLRAQVIGPVLARLRSFLLRDFIKDTIGAPRSSFDMGRVLNGGILIARLPKGQLGDDASRLLGSLVLASVWQAATARARLPEEKRRDATIYVDESHNVLNLAGSVSDMLAEARAYHLSLVLAHQDLAQLPRETQLALSANARNKIYFNCSPEDASQLGRHTLPELDEHDLSHLDAYTAATRLVIGNRETAAFTLITNPPRPATGDLEQIRATIAETATAREQSRLRHQRSPQPDPAPSIPAPSETPASDPPAMSSGRVDKPRDVPRIRPLPASTRPPNPTTNPTGTNPQAGGPS